MFLQHRALVRIYLHNELIKTHERKPRGGRATDYNDYPEGKAPYAMRWPNFYCKRTRELGPSIGDFTDQLLSGEFPWSRLRPAQKLLGFAPIPDSRCAPRLSFPAAFEPSGTVERLNSKVAFGSDNSHRS